MAFIYQELSQTLESAFNDINILLQNVHGTVFAI